MKKKIDLNSWKDVASDELRGTGLEKLNKKTPEGITVKPLYTEKDLNDLDHLNTLPGIEPFLRGPKATMYT